MLKASINSCLTTGKHVTQIFIKETTKVFWYIEKHYKYNYICPPYYFAAATISVYAL